MPIMPSYDQGGYLDIEWLTEEFEKRCREISEEIGRPLQPEEPMLIFLSILQELYEVNPTSANELFYAKPFLNLCYKYRLKEF